MRLSLVERRVMAQAVALSLDPAHDTDSAARALVRVAGADARVLERVLARLRSAVPRSGRVSQGAVRVVTCALVHCPDAPATSSVVLGRDAGTVRLSRSRRQHPAGQ